MAVIISNMATSEDFDVVESWEDIEESGVR